jgi:hypothetical protein
MIKDEEIPHSRERPREIKSGIIQLTAKCSTHKNGTQENEIESSVQLMLLIPILPVVVVLS